MIRCRKMTRFELASRPQSAASREESEMMNKSKREAALAKDTLEKLRLLCLAKGTSGILEFGRLLRKMSPSPSFEEFASQFKKSNLDLDDVDIENLYGRFNTDGNFDIEAFLASVVPKLPESRLKVVNEAFDKLDVEKENAIKIEKLKSVYCVTKNTKFLSGEQYEEDIKQKFFNIFESGSEPGKITREEFFHYYSGISASLDSDIHFDLMMRQSYKL